MIIHSVVVQNQAPVADAVVTHELAVNPLSVILVKLTALNDTGTIGNFASYLGLMASLNRISVLYRGSSIFSMTGSDAAALAALRHGLVPWMANHENTNNARVVAVLPILLGRRAYDPFSCFPASRSGELILELDFDIADTGYDALNYSVETVQLLGATPAEYERKVQLTQTFAAVGLNDIDLPVGNVVRGILAFGTTGFTGAAPAPTLGRMATVVDGVEIGYSSIDFETAHALPALWGSPVPAYDKHIHGIDGTILPSDIGDGGWQNYCFLNFDPNADDVHSIDSREVSRFQLRVDAETNDLARLTAVERIGV